MQVEEDVGEEVGLFDDRDVGRAVGKALTIVDGSALGKQEGDVVESETGAAVVLVEG